MTRTACTSDRGDIVLGWLTKLAASLAVVGLVGFDGVSILSKRFTAEDHAQSAARAAVSAYRDTRSAQKAYDAALAEVAQHGETIDAGPAFVVAQDGSITLTLRTEAPTMLVEKVPPLREWASLSTTVTGRPAV